MKRQAPRRRRQGARSTATRQVRPYQAADDALGLEIQAALKTDKAGGGRLRWCEPTPDGPEFDCYCAVSAGGYFFLKGEELASFDPLAPAETVDWEAAGRAAYKGSGVAAASAAGQPAIASIEDYTAQASAQVTRLQAQLVPKPGLPSLTVLLSAAPTRQSPPGPRP